LCFCSVFCWAIRPVLSAAFGRPRRDGRGFYRWRGNFPRTRAYWSLELLADVNAFERTRAGSHCEQCWGRLSSNRAGNPARVSRVFESTRRPSLLLCDFLACAQNTGTEDGSVGHNPALISRTKAEKGMRVHSARSQAFAASLFPLRFRRDVTLICRGLPKPVD